MFQLYRWFCRTSLRLTPDWIKRCFVTQAKLSGKVTLELPVKQNVFEVQLGERSLCNGDIQLTNTSAYDFEIDRLIIDLKVGFTHVDIAYLHRTPLRAHSSITVPIRSSLTGPQKQAIDAYGLQELDTEVHISAYLNAMRWHFTVVSNANSKSLCKVYDRRDAVTQNLTAAPQTHGQGFITSGPVLSAD